MKYYIAQEAVLNFVTNFIFKFLHELDVVTCMVYLKINNGLKISSQMKLYMCFYYLMDMHRVYWILGVVVLYQFSA